jgi:hypothetical protein
MNFNPTSAQWSGQAINIVSIGTTAVPLSELKVRYWFDADGQTPSPPVCNSAWMIGCPNVTVRFVTPPAPAPVGGNRYLEIGFAAGAPMLAAGGQTADIQTAFHYDGFPTVNRTNDYSFDASKTSLTDWTHVTLYHNGNKVWGTEP